MDTEQDNGVVKLHKDNKRARLSAVNINNGLRKKEEIHKYIKYFVYTNKCNKHLLGNLIVFH